MYDLRKDYVPEGLLRIENNPKIPVNGDLLAAKIIGFETSKHIIYVDLGHNNYGFILEENYYFSPKSNNSKLTHGTNIIGAKVICKKSTNFFELSRKASIEEAFYGLKKKIGDVTDAYITSLVPYGAFIDLGLGVTSLLHISELGETRYSKIQYFFKQGDIVKVKLLRFEENDNFFYVSRKNAYSNDMSNFKPDTLIDVTVADRLYDNSGYFVEVSPAISGIMDFFQKYYSYTLSPGDTVCAKIKKIKSKGLTLDFISKI